MTDPTVTSLRDEIAAMRRLAETVETLDPAARSRALRWLVSRSYDLDSLDALFGVDELHDEAPVLAAAAEKDRRFEREDDRG